MKVKDLKDVLNNVPDDYDVLVEWKVVNDTSNCFNVVRTETDKDLELFILKKE